MFIGNAVAASPAIYRNLQEIYDKFDVIMFDSHGVLWSGREFYENTKDLMAELVRKGKIVYVISNMTEVSSDAKKDYDNEGIVEGKHFHSLITSGEYTRRALLAGELKFEDRSNPTRVYMLGSPNTAMFKGTKYKVVQNIKDADFVYVSMPRLSEEQFKKYPNKEQLRESALDLFGSTARTWDSLVIDPFIPELKKFKKYNLPMLITSPNLMVEESARGSNEKNLVVRHGAIAEAYEMMGGRVIRIGKPHREIFDLAVRDAEKRLARKLERNRILMVGDSIGTDICGAKNAGLKSALCVETGTTFEKLKKQLELKYKELQKDAEKLAKFRQQEQKIRYDMLLKLQKEKNCVADYMIEGVSIGYVAR
ncbi:MAG: HAD hydrolase-like protein [Rickettsiales bacterium]|jgi:HAD superfamily hydrolase (TIGR01450 family)|nr:HAD hydrolase-like protein [Rickettsiales bacterium]